MSGYICVWGDKTCRGKNMPYFSCAVPWRSLDKSVASYKKKKNSWQSNCPGLDWYQNCSNSTAVVLLLKPTSKVTNMSNTQDGSMRPVERQRSNRHLLPEGVGRLASEKRQLNAPIRFAWRLGLVVKSYIDSTTISAYFGIRITARDSSRELWIELTIPHH